MDTIAVIDFGGQYAHLIATRVRRMGVYSEIFTEDIEPEQLKGFSGIILSGGPQSVNEPDAPKVNNAIFEMGIPVLGICYGHQYLNYVLGGKPRSADGREYGISRISLNTESPLFAGMKPDSDETFQMWNNHGDDIAELAPGFTEIGHSEGCNFAAIAFDEKKIYGVQFHPEVTHSLQGNTLLENFVVGICGAKKEWGLNDSFVQHKLDEIRDQVGDKKVFLLVSGGVDSSVAFSLIAKAIGNDNVYGLFVNTGLMRKNEVQEVTEALKGIGVNLHVYDASKEFFSKLEGKYKPEEKRIIIGDTFLEIKDSVAADLGLLEGDWILGQGTIYPDTIESGGTKRADKIKTHHNRVDAIQELIQAGKIIEPLADLYKDEVREIGRLLGLPEQMIKRHPFPGPGLGVRCLCLDASDDAQEIDAVKSSLTDIDGYTLEVLPLKSVGVQGDARSYQHAAIVCGEENFEKMGHLATELINKNKGINRAVYCLSHRSIDSITALHHSFLTPDRVALLQEADALVTRALHKHSLYDTVWQFPVVLVPVSLNDTEGESIILRPVHSTEAMTAEFAKLPKAFTQEVTEELMKIEGISAVFYDITNKPPGTIEWE